ncbi:branched-chain amino acid ABC transporter permease [Pigmentiphaga sp.]|uniref:branched-chain amino acid ABC transporter permease n=1 Tax=Pigmentiphaga sp. TaxID=1977564 RepID=UPI00128E4730|nr:branched-chain amino acid ABC transporter permease [Pigmentiphaga sp.]MPS26097.1 branched-chain amino acid ABC transporter permease [Alcaligenaceae bacterium SAGV5]MPS53132.1 branched-chain amino acid ABC transporter permease [Alcaligenaceae bacterium SAGV3]MPT58943.1 branched-chain amino acid ABC transporter permease [Alcaligenaceae bacterium]
MNSSLFLSQLLNGVQLGVLLFLLSSGLTLIFGIMNFINLAHGSLYMVGAFIGAASYNASGSFIFAIAAAIIAAGLVGLLLEHLVARPLYRHDHLYQVLATFGLMMFFNELAIVVFGNRPYYAAIPSVLNGAVTLFGSQYPVYRILIIAVGVLVALGAWYLIQKTRFGMLIRAGASNSPMVSVLGVNIDLLKKLLFMLGAGLAGLAGALAGPILSVQSGMGEPVLILALVVIVVGGIGSIRGALVAAMLIAVIDTLGRAYIPHMLGSFMQPASANAVGPATASMLIYILMALVLAFRPNGILSKR